jgi:hypothetical protein
MRSLDHRARHVHADHRPERAHEATRDQSVGPCTTPDVDDVGSVGQWAESERVPDARERRQRLGWNTLQQLVGVAEPLGERGTRDEVEPACRMKREVGEGVFDRGT